MLFQTLLTAACLAASVLAAGPAATVIIEAKDNGSLKNTTVTIPINGLYVNSTTLTQVSTLYLTGASGVSANSVSCIPFSKPDGSGTKLGRTFSVDVPSYLTTSDKDVGSIVCITSAISQAPQGPGGSGSSSASLIVASSSATALTSKASHTTAHTTVKSQSLASPSGPTATASASQSAGNAANGLSFSGEIFGGLALAGFGLAFAL